MIIPAELTIIVGGLVYSFIILSKAFFILLNSPTSNSRAKCFWSEYFVITLIVSSTFLILLSAATTEAPSLANTSHVALPIPEPPPKN
ncbi:hypothetical protein NQ314_009988 [Rhamnusium bicolor]|uniref:Uncharacterized protein n=1 Tax=Rhamnusium bicolor TaxID=1586634 RepID=A0AAV8XU86_9CUCU|nr:hypothetical protein NQ314_009988 [Rhamnusium bicolor]